MMGMWNRSVVAYQLSMYKLYVSNLKITQILTLQTHIGIVSK